MANIDVAPLCNITACPPCFDQVAVQFRETVELYQQLLVRLNFTLEAVAGGGVSPTLLAIAEEYRRILQGLLERAVNATIMLVHYGYYTFRLLS